MPVRTFSNPAGNERCLGYACPICGSSVFTFLWEVEGARFHRCCGCGHLQQYPVPVQEELSLRYGEEYLSYELSNEEAFFSLMAKALDDVGFSSLTASRGLAGGRFLDIGCATGRLIEHLRKHGWRAEGVEVCSPTARYGIEHRGVPISISTLEQAAFGDQAFQVVHASHLIEHLSDPVAFLQEAHRILDNRGLLVLTTPNSAGLQAKLFGSGWRSVIPDHIHLFGRKNFLTLLRSNGFSPLSWKTWGGIAKGLVSETIKRPVDRFAKLSGLGDVMIVLSEKR
jgi:2-polyprenyl-3-methyl-5-hydroxy-6-metoxy-1,4-benzoquinol methylase